MFNVFCAWWYWYNEHSCSPFLRNYFSSERNWQSKSSIKSASSRDSPNFNPVQRKVAWESDADVIDSQSDRANSQNDENIDEQNDSFRHPIFTSGDSSNEYDTDLETESPRK